MKTLKLAIVAFGFAGAAFAQGPAGGPPGLQAMTTACQADITKLCAGKDMRGCMDENKDKLSKQCKTARDKFIASMPAGGPAGGPPPAVQAMITACQADITALCGGKDMRACLEENKSKLSKGCTDAQAKLAASFAAGGPPPGN